MSSQPVAEISKKTLDAVGPLVENILDRTSQTVLVVLAGEDVFTRRGLERILRVTERVEQLELVESVSSLSTAVNIRSEDGTLYVDPFFDDEESIDEPVDPSEIGAYGPEPTGWPEPEEESTVFEPVPREVLPPPVEQTAPVPASNSAAMWLVVGVVLGAVLILGGVAVGVTLLMLR